MNNFRRASAIALVLIFLAIGILPFWMLRKPEAAVDQNNDGIRDDVEALIEKKYAPDKNTRAAARYFAKYVQKTIADPDNATYRPAVDCVYFTNPQLAGAIISDVESRSVDTVSRVRALYRYSARFNGQVINEAQSKEEACAGDPELSK